MGENKWGAVCAGALLVLSACAAPGQESSVGASYGANEGADPTSLSELAVVGGATYEGLTPEELAGRSELAIEAIIIDIRPSHLNTSDGLFPSTGEILAKGLSDLTVMTEVTVEIVSTLGKSDEAPSLANGDTFTLGVGGGAFYTTLSVEQATALGVTAVDQDFPEHTEGDGLPPDVEIEEPVETPVRITWGTTTDMDLTEGDHVALFLTKVTVAAFEAGESDVEYWSPVHPYAVFHRSPDGGWIPSGVEYAGVNPVELAKLISS